MGGKKPLRRPLWPPTRATASNYYPLGLDGAGGAAKPLLRAPKKPAPLHGRLPAFSGAVDAFGRARKCFLEWRYFFSIILSEFLKNRVALQLFATEIAELEAQIEQEKAVIAESEEIIAAWISGIEDGTTRTILRLRFIHGLQWCEIAGAVGKRFTEARVKYIARCHLKAAFNHPQ